MRYLKDPNEPIKSIEKIRVSVRAILLNDKAELGYLYYKGQDLFGIRNHFESVGGGINPEESLIDALKREVKEETGFTIQDIDYLDSIIDEYGKLNQV
ncbi:MAG TPA: NUDIX hydrolase, partial [Erysipelothrix sp.]